MCGIAGFVDLFRRTSRTELARLAGRMASTLKHRGPDDAGVWVDEAAGVALGHRRLAIVDLSAEGHQPMESACGRHVLVFNGEIYNFRELRRELEAIGHRFRGASDTEVLLAAISEWGVDPAVRRLNGMFAFAVWDRWNHALYLARDRIGEKPLYYGRAGHRFVFGSELKAFEVCPEFAGEVERHALKLLLQYGHIPAPFSIFQGVYKLLPGSILMLGTNAASPEPRVTRYWWMSEVAERGLSDRFAGSAPEAVDALHSLINDAVRLRMVADVPVGAFLSGGVDSSAVVALMQANSRRPVKTFTIGFHEAGFNEAQYARNVATALGTEHTEVYLSSRDAMVLVPELPALYDEPFADASQLPTLLVSRLARGFVKVALSGDGGDEIFGGYRRYLWVRNISRLSRWTPRGLKKRAADVLSAVPPQGWEALFRTVAPMVAAARQRTPSHDMYRIADLLRIESPGAMYENLMALWKTPAALVAASNGHVPALETASEPPCLPDSIERMMYLDTVGYLPDDILVKVDRASMSVGLEARIPILDHRVIEFAWRLPLAMKMRGGQGKWILRELLLKHVPKRLVDRPKKGFGVPIDQWLRGPLREWAEELLDEEGLRQQGYLNAQPIRQKWAEHLSMRQNWSAQLWTVLMFQSWLQHRKEARSQEPEWPAAATR